MPFNFCFFAGHTVNNNSDSASAAAGRSSSSSLHHENDNEEDDNADRKRKKNKPKPAKVKKPSTDMYAMACQACGMEKKTVSGLKMHIKVLHLHLGRLQCRHCSFTANLKKSINGHYKANHPDSRRQDESGGALPMFFLGLRIRSIFGRLRIRILQIRILKPDPDPGSYCHLKNQFKHHNFFHIKHISSDI